MGGLLGHIGLLLPGSSGGSAYTTLNPADKAANVTLSGGNLTAVGAATSAGIVRSINPLAGKRYFEARFNSVTVHATAVIAAGVAKSTASLTASLGYSNADAWALWGTNTGARHNGVTAVSVVAVPGDVIGFAVDEPGHKLWIRMNGVWLGSGSPDPATDTSPIWTNLNGTLYAAACPWDSGASITMRFDPASFRDPAPAGFGPITA